MCECKQCVGLEGVPSEFISSSEPPCSLPAFRLEHSAVAAAPEQRLRGGRTVTRFWLITRQPTN